MKKRKFPQQQAKYKNINIKKQIKKTTQRYVRSIDTKSSRSFSTKVGGQEMNQRFKNQHFFSLIHQNSNIQNDSNIKLSSSQQYAFDIGTKQSLFLSAPAGYVKSVVMRKLEEYFVEEEMKIQKIAFLANTAFQMHGKTIHSFLNIPAIMEPNEKKEQTQIVHSGNREQLKEEKEQRDLTNMINQILNRMDKSVYRQQAWQDLQVIIIDEISMVSKDLLEILHRVACHMTGKDHMPFGGLQMIFIGDFFQLPPVSNKDQNKVWFAFEHRLWNHLFTPKNCVILQEAFRQTNKQWLKVLNEIRWGVISEEGRFYLQQMCMRSNLEQQSQTTTRSTHLYPMNHLVDRYNQKELQKEPQQDSHIYTIQCSLIHYKDKDLSYYEKSIKRKQLVYKKNWEYMYQEVVKYSRTPYDKQKQIPLAIELRLGSRIMITENLDTAKGICNHACGTVIDFCKPKPELLEWMNVFET